VERIRILIVDDDDDLRRVLRVMLEAEEDFDVVGEAADGFEAVWDAGRTQPDVVVLDYRMPGRTGEETADMVRRAASGAKVLGFSAYADVAREWADLFLLKDQVAEVPDAIRSLAAGSREAG
jgi:DNA-binding NarL/FixJ family response regulator